MTRSLKVGAPSWVDEEGVSGGCCGCERIGSSPLWLAPPVPHVAAPGRPLTVRLLAALACLEWLCVAPGDSGLERSRREASAEKASFAG
jgi:hypothetical protein